MKESKYIKNGEGQDFDYSQDHCYVKLSSRDTKGELCMVEDALKPGFFLARHHHKIMTEIFYVLEGEVELIFDDKIVAGQKGDTIIVPPNLWHAASSEKGGRMLTIFKNGQFDIYLERISRMKDEDFENADLMKSLSEEFDIYSEE